MRMDLLYSDKFRDDAKPMPEAYERLLLEVLAADQSNFVSAPELDASWRIFTPILNELAENKIKPLPYPYGSRGPPQADDLANRHGMSKFGGGITNYVQGEKLRKIDSKTNMTANDQVANRAPKENLFTAANASLLASAAETSTTVQGGGGGGSSSQAAKGGAVSSAASDGGTSAAGSAGGSSAAAISDVTDPAPPARVVHQPRPIASSPKPVSPAAAPSSNPATPILRTPDKPPSSHLTLNSAGIPRLHTRSPTSDVDDELAKTPPAAPAPGSEAPACSLTAAFSSGR